MSCCGNSNRGNGTILSGCLPKVTTCRASLQHADYYAGEAYIPELRDASAKGDELLGPIKAGLDSPVSKPANESTCLTS